MSTLQATAATPATSAVTPPAYKRSRGHWANVAARIVRNPLAMTAAVILLALIGVAVFAPWIMPADPFATSMFTRR